MKYLLFILLTTISYSQIILNPNRADVLNPPATIWYVDRDATGTGDGTRSEERR